MTKDNSQTRLILRRPGGFEVWAKWDDSAEIYELFASENGDDYIGCCDTLKEARDYALERWSEEQIGA